MDIPKYIKARGIWYETAIRSIRKKDENLLQPIFEAFTNSLEAINILKERHNYKNKGSISISLFLTKNLLSKETKQYDFQRFEIFDTGIGFDETEFERFVALRDNRKGYSNKGTGRVQFLHTFDKTEITSIYKDKNSSTGFKLRKLTLSKSAPFLANNAIIRIDASEEIKAEASSTTIVFKTVLNQKDKTYFETLSAEEIKQEIIFHYIAYLCENRANLPQINIKIIVDDNVKTDLEIKSDDIPIPDQEKPIDVYYSKVNGSSIEKTSKKETLNLKAFKINQNELDKNALKLISKGEVAKDITLENLLPTDQIENNRYLFLLSGEYIDNRDSDTRGEINIPKKADFKKQNTDTLFGEEEILIDDIEDKANQTIVSLYKEIEDKRKEKEKNIEELQEMFLLNPETLKSLQRKINIGDSDDVILRKVYEADAKIIAKKDAEIKHQIEELEELDPSESNYQEVLNKKVNDFVVAIPLQNKTALTQYVARRKMVIELFDKILDKEILKLKTGGRIDEDILHNLIFQQSTENPEISDLWLIGEDFIYFKGFSENQLNKIKIDDVEIFNKKFTEEEERYLNSLGEKRLTKRPDVLLFPDEGKCIIIEFKAPDVNVSEHLSQIDFYANLIRNYTIDDFQITTFYGYLIGESIEDRDVRGRVSRFEHSYHLDYWFRPSENVTGFDKRSNGSLYTEVIKFSTLLKRAKLRNEIFINKLDGIK